MALLIGLGAGAAAALLAVSATTGALFFRIFLSLLSMLPIFMAGLGWGIRSALVAATTCAALIGLVAGPPGAGIWFISQGLPVVVLCYYAYLNRQQAAGPPINAGSNDAASSPPAATSVEWYPLGRLVASAAAMGGVLTGLSALLLDTDFKALRQKVRAALEALFKQLPDFAPMAIDDAALDKIADITLAILPAAGAFVWVAILLFNLWLAARLTLASGRLARPWPDLAAITFPPGMGLALAAAVMGSFLGGMAGLVATGFAGAFLCAYVLLGLAIVHYVSRGHPFRGFILSGLYAALFFFNTYAVFALALIGLAEPFSPLNRRLGRQPPPPPDNNRST